MDPPAPDGIAFGDVQVAPPAARPWPPDQPGVQVQAWGDADLARLPIFARETALADATVWVQARRLNEAGGVLVGHHGLDAGREFVTVDAFLAAPKCQAGPAHLVFTHEAFAECEAAREQLDPSLAVVGWCHSHPGYGVFLSEADQFIHTQFFPLPWQVALVIDPRREELGFFRMAGGATTRTGFFLLGPAVA